MKRPTTLLIAILLLACSTAVSQTRRRAPRTTPTPAPRISEAQRQGAVRVADEIKTLTRFLYLLGGVAKGIEEMDKTLEDKETPPAILDQARKNKVIVRTSIQNIRVRLDKLEIDFRTTLDLQRFYIKLAGVASGAATAEQQAALNQLDQAGRSLLGVVNRLADVLVEMP